MDYKRMESELRCVVCCDLFKYPVMLPCGHNICAGCSDKCLSNANSAPRMTVSSPASSTSSSNSPTSRRLSQESLEKLQQGDGVDKDVHSALESDQISMVSDADSGVVCGSSASNKRDSFHSANGSERGLSSLTCPYSRCQKVFLTEEGKASFPANRLMMKILSKYTSSMLSSPASTPTSSSPFPPLCQLCDNDSGQVAVVFCQQCDIYYCPACRDSFHPQRGPLVAHKLLPLDKGSSPGLSPPKDSPQQQLLLHNTYVSAALEQQKCPLHSHEYTMYCSPCRLPLCWRCLEKDTFHQEQHDVQSLQGLSKAKKVRTKN